LSGEGVVARAAELSGLTQEQIRTVIGYYADYRDEIDAWIERVDEEAERAEAAWRRSQAVIGA
jgi:hypothetical protein